MRRIALLTCFFLAALAEPAFGWMPKPVEFARSVPAAVHAAGAHAVTLHTARRFDLVGATWRGRGAPKVWLRARRARDGHWSRWARLPVADAAPHSSDPVWAGGSDAVQLRASRPI